jgi:hypothetical protein
MGFLIFKSIMEEPYVLYIKTNYSSKRAFVGRDGQYREGLRQGSGSFGLEKEQSQRDQLSGVTED